MARAKDRYNHAAVAAALMGAWKDRERILSNEELYGQELDWKSSGGSFCGAFPMPVGLILECWMDEGPFILPDGRRIFQFSGGLSGACTGSAIDMNTGEITPFWSRQGNDLCFSDLAGKRQEIWDRHRTASSGFQQKFVKG